MICSKDCDLRHWSACEIGYSNDFSKYSVLLYNCFLTEINGVAIRVINNVEIRVNNLKSVRIS